MDVGAVKAPTISPRRRLVTISRISAANTGSVPATQAHSAQDRPKAEATAPAAKPVTATPRRNDLGESRRDGAIRTRISCGRRCVIGTRSRSVSSVLLVLIAAVWSRDWTAKFQNPPRVAFTWDQNYQLITKVFTVVMLTTIAALSRYPCRRRWNAAFVGRRWLGGSSCVRPRGSRVS
jgi:hypothetical protein